MRVTVIPIVIGALGTFAKNLEKTTGEIGNQMKNRDYRDHSSVKIG